VSFSVANGNTVDLTLRIAAPQLELGAFATSYIPTTTASATRSADSAIVNPISSFYNQAEGTLFAEYSGAQPNKGIMHFDDATNSERVAIIVASGTAVPVGLVVRSSTQANISIGSTPSLSEIIKFGFVAKQDDFQAARGGTLGVADTSGQMPSVSLTHLVLGGIATGGAPFGGHIRKVAYYPKRLSNTRLQSLTT